MLILFLIIIFGTIIGFMFDGYRVIVGKNNIPKVLLFLMDVIFGVIAALFLFQLILWINYGQIRIIMIVIFFCSLLSYYFILSKSVVKKWVKVYNLFNKIFKYAIKILNKLLIRPIILIFSFIVYMFKNFFIFIYTIFYKIVVVIVKKIKQI